MAKIDSELEKDALENKKKKLEEIRALHKPLEKSDLMSHALNYERIRMDKELIQREKRRALLRLEEERKGQLPTFSKLKSSMDSDALDMLRAPGQLLGIEREKTEATQAKKLAHSKITNYGKYVREMYWPKVSEKNQSAMAHLKGKAVNENKATKQAPKHRVIVDTNAWRHDSYINKS